MSEHQDVHDDPSDCDCRGPWMSVAELMDYEKLFGGARPRVPFPGVIGARGRKRTCQEASSLSRETYVACGLPAVAIVDNGDERPYWMCDACADHNVKHRGAQRWIRLTVCADHPEWWGRGPCPGIHS